MKTILLSSLCTVALMAASTDASLIITGVVDGPRSGGLPKAIELRATSNIPDLSIYNVETPNNGAVPTGMEYALSGSASAGDFIYIASEAPGFTAYFGFAPNFTNSVANINGDDNVILYENGVTIDAFGNIEDGTGKFWDYEDGYAYRKNGTVPDPNFSFGGQWTFSGTNYLDSQGTSGVNGSDGKTVPFGTYVPEPNGLALIMASIGALTLRRK